MAIKENAFGLFSMYLHPFIKCFVFLKTLNLHLEEIDNNRSAQRPQLIFCPDLAYTGNSSGFLIYFSFFFYYFFFFFFGFLSFSVTEFLLVLATVEPLYKSHLGNRRNWPLQRGFKQESMYGLFCPPGRKKWSLSEGFNGINRQA